MQPIWIRNYPARVNPSPVIPPISAAQMIREACETYADREAYWSMGASLSYRELLDNARCVTRWLQSAGIAKGERVAIMLPNVMTFPVCIFGALLGGYVVVNVNPHYTARELAYQLKDAGASVLFAWQASLPVVEKAWPELALRKLVVVSPRDLLDGERSASAVPAGAERFADVLREGSRQPPDAVEVSPDDLAFLQYTGGTTGISKGAMILHRNVVAQAVQRATWNKPIEKARVLVAFPLYHVAALHGQAFTMLYRGGACALAEDARDTDSLIDMMKTQRFTTLGFVNSLYSALANHPRIREADFSALISCGAGGAATQRAVAQRWQEVSGLPLAEAYGMSETTCVSTISDPDVVGFDGTVGYPLPLTEVSIRDDAGQELETGEIGEICVRGPQVMAGYWNRPDETADAITRDGYLRTGDVGSIDSRGRVRISDRKKDMLLVSGFNVFPNEIEGVLVSHPRVLEAAVVGVPDERSGEAPIAFVVPRDASLTADELLAFCRENLTGYKRPRRIELRDSLPKTPVGKIMRRALREELEREISGAGSLKTP